MLIPERDGYGVMIHTFVEAVDGIRQTIRTHAVALSKNEMMTRYALIDPLLRELGWDLSDPEMSVPEDIGPGGKPDYTLGSNAMIVEAKKLDENLDKYADKLISYVRGRKVRYGVLTNGQIWKMYDTDTTTKSPEIEFDITDPDGVVVSKALRLHRVVVLESVPQSNVPKPSSDDYGYDGYMRADSLDTAPTNIGETHNTIIYKDQSWTAEKCMADLLVSVAAWLVRKGYLTAKHCPIEAGPENYLLHTKPSHSDGREFSKHKRLAKKMYLNTAFNSTDMILCTLDLMEAAGLDRSEIWIGRRYP